MSKTIWSTEETSRLIEMYRDHRNLWNPKDSEYKNRIKKNDSLKELGNTFNVTTPEIDRKLKNILSQYRRERRNYKKFKKSGVAWKFHAKWFGYNLMSFLHDKNKARKGLQTVEETEVSDSSLSSDTNTQETLMESQVEEFTQDEQQEELQESEEQNITPDVHNIDITPSIIPDVHSKAVPQPAKEKKNKTTQNEPQIEMVNLMKTLCKQREQKHEVDEYDLYGELVARKLKKLSTNYARSTVQNMFNIILYEAEIGKYDAPSTSFQQNLSFNNMQHSGYSTPTSYSNPPTVSTTYSNPPSVTPQQTEFINEPLPTTFGFN